LGGISFDHFSKVTKNVNVYISLFIHIISEVLYQQFTVNYASKFWELIEATTYNCILNVTGKRTA
jgi:hypothetical protein